MAVDRADPSVVSLLVRWPGKVLEELLLAPWTLARVRHSLTELPVRIDALNESLAEMTASLDGTLPQLDERLAGVAVDLVRFREAMDQLSETLIGVVGSIPGVRRALRQ